MLVSGEDPEMKQRLVRTLSRIPSLKNQVNASLINDFYIFERNDGTSETFQDNHLKTIIMFAKWLEDANPKLTFFDFTMKEREIIAKFLQSKLKSEEDDPQQTSLRTYNDYGDRIKTFFRWLHNVRLNESGNDTLPKESWETPDFAKFKHRKLKTHSPYAITEKWTLEEFQLATDKETNLVRRTAFKMLWDLDARNHEILNIKRKNIKFNDRYAEGEIPKGKTGSRAFVLTNSFWDAVTWYNSHPFQHGDAPFICDSTGQAISPDTLRRWMYDLRDNIKTMIANGDIPNNQEAKQLKRIIEEKRWNPYCIRHSAITHDSDILTEHGLKKKAGWTMNSKQGGRYISNNMSQTLKHQILNNAGINPKSASVKPVAIDCPKCKSANPPNNKVCSKCAYPLNYEAYVQEKEKEEFLSHRVERLEKFLMDTVKLDNELQGMMLSDLKEVISQRDRLKEELETLRVELEATKGKTRSEEP
jgi:hypothetical protein